MHAEQRVFLFSENITPCSPSSNETMHLFKTHTALQLSINSSSNITSQKKVFFFFFFYPLLIPDFFFPSLNALPSRP